MSSNLSSGNFLDRIGRFQGNTDGWELWPSKTDTRGKLLSEDLEKVIEFQFNPTKLNIRKDQKYHNREYPGRMGVEPIWISGGVREVTFQLMFDATAGSAYKKIGLFNKNLGKFSSNVTLNSNRNPGEEVAAEVSQNPRGTLDIIETLESFMYPMLSDFRKPRFTDGVAIFDSNSLFLPPPTVIFIFGLLYMESKMTMQYRHTLFNRDLIPIRSEVDVTLNILEGTLVSEEIKKKYS